MRILIILPIIVFSPHNTVPTCLNAHSTKINFDNCLLFFQSVVFETPKINRCFLVENNDTAVLKTEGVNLQVTGLCVTCGHLGFKCLSLAWGLLSNLLVGREGRQGRGTEKYAAVNSLTDNP